MHAGCGAYGFVVDGIDDVLAMAVGAAADWWVLHLEATVVAGALPDGIFLGRDSASIRTASAHIRLNRRSRRILVRSTKPLSQTDLVHPCLWPAAAVFSRWRGAETFHAGAFLDEGGGAWAVLGDRQAGKSSLLAALALEGRHVVADDLLVVDSGGCYAGPRGIDLRPEAVGRLAIQDQTTPVRSTQRRRLMLAPSGGQFPLRGFIYLEWGKEVSLKTMTPGEHFGRLTAHRRVAGLGAEHGLLLDLAGLPALILRRPRAWSRLTEARDALLARVDDIAP